MECSTLLSYVVERRGLQGSRFPCNFKYTGLRLRGIAYEDVCLGNPALPFWKETPRGLRVRASLLTNPLLSRLSRCRHEIPPYLNAVLPDERAVSLIQQCAMSEYRYSSQKNIKGRRLGASSILTTTCSVFCSAQSAPRHGSHPHGRVSGRCARRLLKRCGVLLLVRGRRQVPNQGRCGRLVCRVRKALHWSLQRRLVQQGQTDEH